MRPPEFTSHPRDIAAARQLITSPALAASTGHDQRSTAWVILLNERRARFHFGGRAAGTHPEDAA